MVSIIVPIYNCEKYLERCIVSILNQTYSDLELILVNDGSTDGSLDVCKKFIAADNRIKLINKINTGVSDSRNKGLQMAKGKLIGFVDADDWVDNSTFDKAIEALIINDADYVIFDYWEVTKSNERTLKTSSNIIGEKNITEEEIDNIINNIIGGKDNFNTDIVLGTIWRGVFKKEIINRNGISFDTSLTLGEDLLFLIKYLKSCGSVFYLDIPLYYYNYNPNSITRRYQEGLIAGIISLNSSIIDVLSTSKSSDWKNHFENRVLNVTKYMISNETKEVKISSLLERINRIKYIINQKEILLFIKEMDFKKYYGTKKIIVKWISYKKSVRLFIFYFIVNSYKTILGK
ncbi:MAG: glycosyltransferase [Clostridiales bacterium]|nr:glycosyltransferase [Clostridiales bacterium]